MQEIRENIRCTLVFAQDLIAAVDALKQANLIAQNSTVAKLNNPLPTGDHWKVIEWVTDYKKRGDSVLSKIPLQRRDFIKKAVAALDADGFCIEIVSKAARKFRDENQLRMQRGKVFAFIEILNKANFTL